MAGFFQRLFKLGEAEAHSIVDRLEDPVKMTEQGIRDLKKDLETAMTSFAEVKAIAIRAQRDMEKGRIAANDWERKAMALLQQGQSGAIEMANAERLAAEALARKAEAQKSFVVHKQAYDKQNQTILSLQTNIDRLKSQIQQYENELVTLRARAKTAEATHKINRQLANVDSSGTVALLERMKNKVEEEETLALAYGEMAAQPKGLDDEIEMALLQGKPNQGLLNGPPASNPQSDALAALKEKMGIV